MVLNRQSFKMVSNRHQDIFLTCDDEITDAFYGTERQSVYYVEPHHPDIALI